LLANPFEGNALPLKRTSTGKLLPAEEVTGGDHLQKRNRMRVVQIPERFDLICRDLAANKQTAPNRDSRQCQ
jgi:hypothetical protein